MECAIVGTFQTLVNGFEADFAIGALQLSGVLGVGGLCRNNHNASIHRTVAATRRSVPSNGDITVRSDRSPLQKCSAKEIWWGMATGPDLDTFDAPRGVEWAVTNTNLKGH